ncbi:MAG TPA: hypothetical protein VER58_12400 [Thermoanaerobaculia bacterium]|nr:hypothetical protein [Thermoanaerobaculia bacterium]
MVWRRIGATILGIIVAALIVQCAELIVHFLYPPPPGYNMRNMDEVKKFVAALPALAMVVVLIGWLIGTLAGTFLGAKIGRSRVPAYIIGALLFLGGIANATMIPQPVWFSVASFVIYIGGTIAGAMLGRPAVPSPAG